MPTLNFSIVKSCFHLCEGPDLVLSDLGQTKSRSTSIKLSQTIYSDRDKSKSCVNYPTEKYNSYEECDQSNVYQRVLDEFNLVPFWTTRSLGEVSETRFCASHQIIKIMLIQTA